MAQYQTGTVSVTQNTNIIAGVGTSWLSNVAIGASFKVAGVPALYSIIAVDSNTQLQISPNYAGATVSGGSYQISTDFTPSLGLAEISTGDSEFAFHLTHEVIRKLDTIVAGKCPTAGPGSGQAFSVGTLSSTATSHPTSDSSAVHLALKAPSDTRELVAGYDTTSDFGYIQSRQGGNGYKTLAVNPLGGVTLVGTSADNGSGAKLQVAGAASFGVLNTTNGSAYMHKNGEIRLYDGTGGNYVQIKNDQTSGGGIAIKAGGVESFRVSNAGNTLVGTATDDTINKLQVNGGISCQNLTASYNGVSVAAASTTGIGILGTLTNHPLQIYSNGAPRMQVTADGSVLVGVTTDNGSGAKLQVSGKATFTDNVKKNVINGWTSTTAWDFWVTAVSNTSVRLSMVGNDGVTRSVNLTLS